MKTVITSGTKYIDIDALACAVAYRDFLRLTGEDAYAMLSDNLNEGITPTVRNWGYLLDKRQISRDDKVIVVDISSPAHIQQEVNQNNIIEIFDHHTGYEIYWQNKLGDKSHIEHIGACATLIYEKIAEKNMLEKLQMASINLLYTAILSNTLYLRMHLTHARDRIALERLKKISDLPANWPEIYFEELEENIFKDPLKSLQNDTKLDELNGTQIAIAQIELWDAKRFSEQNHDLIIQDLKAHNIEYWLYTAPSISENKNYLICSAEKLQAALKKTIGARFSGLIGETSELWLRKEIMKKLMDIHAL